MRLRTASSGSALLSLGRLNLSLFNIDCYQLLPFSLTTTKPLLGSSASEYSPTLTLNVSPATTDTSLDSLSPFPNHHLTHLRSDTRCCDMLVQSDSLIGERTVHWYTKSLSCNILVVHYPLSVLPPPYLHRGVPCLNTH